MLNSHEALFRASCKLATLSPLGWGGIQYYVESTGQEKGPIGLAEEFVEGSVPSAIMAFAFWKVARRYSADLPAEERLVIEASAYQLGALIGYLSMMVGGRILHDTFNIDDVKWGL